MTASDAARVETLYHQARTLHVHGRRDEARNLCRQALDMDPTHFNALHFLGVMALQESEVDLAIELLGRAVAVHPGSLAAHVNYGTALHERGRFDEAAASCDRAIALDPCCAEAFYNRGNALRELERYEDSLESYERAIALRADYADAYLNRGLSLSALGQREAALVSFEKGLAAQPDHAELHFNRANELRTMDRLEAALAGYERALALQPGYAEAHINRGNVLMEMRRYAAALSCFERAIALLPRFADGHLNRGAALQHLGRYAAAVESYDAAIALRPQHAQAHADRGRALRELKRYEAAIASYDGAISLHPPEAGELRAVRRHIQMQVCDWSGLQSDLDEIAVAVRNGTAEPHPFYILALYDSPSLQRQSAANWVRKHCAHISDRIAGHGPAERIHIGYFSADFYEHATAYLIAQLLELHDRSRFHISAFSFGPPSDTPMRRRLQAACDEFIDVRAMSDADIAALARRRRVDIAVDLKGFTQDNRVGIFARRAAPVQVNFLGYPGTMAAPFVDYLIADPVVVPATHEGYFSEQIIHLPHSYQVNDAKRVIADRCFSREELGLPPAGFVFCCFNNTYKILPATFDRWMRMLARVEGSVLWLLGDNSTAIGNLRRAAAERGVTPQRLIFADRIDLPLHLTRHRAADLFLDTWPCNAHTTASDALWSGLPVLTYAGESFAARVAASLLTAIGLPELITATPAHYENLAVHLATYPEDLKEIRKRLHQNRLTAPLFDTPRYCRALEAAFSGMHERARAKCN
ncbi:MAG TPA: tetratricopeptide repeat protein [Steroidobacteraceae bacterium]|nr:tetratricopeptide repeat protein [Steroidobacteraceae bacterium]